MEADPTAESTLSSPGRRSVDSVDEEPRINAPTGRSSRRSDVLVAAGFLAVGLLEAAVGGSGGNRAVYALAAVVATVPLAWRRSNPGVCAVAVGVSLGPGVLLPTRTDELLAVFGAFLVAVFSLGLHAGPREFRVAIAVTALLVVVPILFRGEGADDALFASLIIGLAAIPSRLLRRRLAEVAALTERAVRAEHELEDRARAAAAAERNRLAREMHDIIGHGVSLMVVHAAAAETHLAEPDVARRSLSAVQDAGRQAVTDLARLLGLLRDEHAEIGLTPQPGLSDLERLAGSARVGGDQLTMRIDGDPERVPATAGLTAYRVVQEGLTNARRHAPGAPVDVVVAVADRAVSVRVANDRPARLPAARQRAGGGAGIAGLRERVALFRGSLHAGPRSDGGFVLDATIPFDRSGR